MVRIRLRRMGAKKQPHYRVVVADQRSPRDGRHIEVIGFYNPRTDPETVEIQEDRALYWLNSGAQPSKPVMRFLEKQGTLARLTRLQAGESMEALMAEYEAAVARQEAGEAEPVEKKAKAEAEVEAEAEAPEEPAEAEAEVEAEAEAPEEPAEAEAVAEVQEEPAEAEG